jgi:hypothetical protein
MRYRQVHLDFHNSGLLKDVGSKFNKTQFQEALKIGHIDSITIFSKCHHGYSYHPTNVGKMHPGLNFDLLQAQLDACAEINVNTVVYISTGLDELSANLHPEWLNRNPNESTMWTENFSKPGYHKLCNNTSYLDYLVLQVEEVMQKYKPNGIFMDIIGANPCYCSKCRNDIINEGKDPFNEKDAKEFGEKVYKNYLLRIEEAIRKYSASTSIFHNAGHLFRGRLDLVETYTHLELESLPTGGWGYDHFPLSAAYARTLDFEFLGMTGKFHKSWGEFGGFKHPNALRYETALSIANGAKCSIGDQLHPLGDMNLSTYRLIGEAYKQVEAKEKWCVKATHIADIGILSDEAVTGQLGSQSDIGANRIMLEGKFLYNVIDADEDFKKYKLLILPDNIRLDEMLSKKIKEYLSNGGKILASSISCLKKDEDVFALDMGIEFVGKNKYMPTYFIPQFEITNGQTQYLMHQQNYVIKQKDAEILAYCENPYFNREVHSFSSHQNTPNNPEEKSPAIAQKSNIIYIAWGAFTDYAQNGSLHSKEMVTYAVDALLGEQKTLKTNLPDKAVVSLTEQKQENRLVAHLLFAHTTVRGNTEVIQDIVPLSNVSLQINCERTPTKVYLAPSMEEIDFEYTNNKISLVVPCVLCHQIVVVDLK